MSQDQSLYIPLGVKAESEWFPGFGQRQLGQAAVGTGIAIASAFILWLLGSSIPLVMVVFLIGVSASVMMTTKDRHNLSVLDQMMFMVRFAKSQKYYPYRAVSQWNLPETDRKL